MALMFPRLARNFVKNGYFPTDEDTLERLLSYFHVPRKQTIIFDPCAGEGVALGEFKHYLNANSYAIEYDAERASHAKQLLDVCIHGDVQDCIIKQNQFGLLFLNPPYGDLVGDTSNLGSQLQKGRQRLEKLFFDLTASALVFGGVMVLIIPESCLDAAFETSIFKRFTNIRAFKAVDPTFKQVVLMGERIRVVDNAYSNQSLAKFRAQRSEDLPVIDFADTPRYDVPFSVPTQPIVYSKLDIHQLEDELTANSGMWPHMNAFFQTSELSMRRPLYQLSDWHLALMLAAGSISGVVVSNDKKRVMLVKGHTHKVKTESVVYHEDSDGNISETVTLTDQFKPVINAIELTNDDRLGDVLSIQ